MKTLTCFIVSTIAFTCHSKDITAKIIYSEASNMVSEYERLCVASVIKNRINNKSFAKGKLKTMEDVVKQRGAFSSYMEKNSNFYYTGNSKAMYQSKLLATGKFKPVIDAHFFHDRSLKNPPAEWGRVKLVKETKYFKFYKQI